MNSTPTETSRVVALLFLLTAVAVVVIISFISRDFSQLLITHVQSGNGALYDYVHEHFIQSVLVYMFLYILVATISLPLESALCVVAGYYFGTTVGTIVAVISATIGALMVFLLIKHFFHDWFHRTIKSASIKKIIHGINTNAFSYLLFLRLVPLFPFFIINLALSFSTVRTRDYILATFIGVIPATFVFVLAGTQLATIRDTHTLLSPATIGVLLLLSFFSLGPLVWKKVLERRAHKTSI